MGDDKSLGAGGEMPPRGSTYAQRKILLRPKESFRPSLGARNLPHNPPSTACSEANGWVNVCSALISHLSGSGSFGPCFGCSCHFLSSTTSLTQNRHACSGGKGFCWGLRSEIVPPLMQPHRPLPFTETPASSFLLDIRGRTGEITALKGKNPQ